MQRKRKNMDPKGFYARKRELLEAALGASERASSILKMAHEFEHTYGDIEEDDEVTRLWAEQKEVEKSIAATLDAVAAMTEPSDEG